MEKSEKKKLLLHSCCAPCSTTAISRLAEDYKVTICYYNPNIYPEEEYIKRKNEQIKLINKLNSEGEYNITMLDVEYDSDNYESKVENLRNEKEGGARCTVCFRLRLEKVASLAKSLDYDLFATTLTVSPHKNAKLINDIGEMLAKEYKISYLPTDFKKQDGYKQSVQLSKKYELYRQNYCGCKYSIWF